MKKMELEEKMKKIEELAMTEERAKELLSRIAESVGLRLEVVLSDSRQATRWCFSIGEARYTNWYYSAKKMLHLVLLDRCFYRVPGSGWDFKSGAKESYPNPFYRLSLDELELKLDLMCPRKPEEL